MSCEVKVKRTTGRPHSSGRLKPYET